MKNDQMVAASAFVVMTTGSLAAVERTGALPGINFWLGIALAYMFIALINQFNGDIGGGLAVLVLVSSLLANGEQLADFIGTRTGGKIGSPKQARERVPQRQVFTNPLRVV